MGEFSSFALVPEQGVVPELPQLPQDMRARISDMASRLDVRDSAAVLGFGARAQKEYGMFSDMALAQMLRTDVDPLDSTMQELAAQIRSCSFVSEAKGLFRRMMGKAAPLSQVRAAYERAEPRISACADEMLRRRVALMNDSALLERLYERNEGLYRELCSLIVVGEEAIRQAKARGEEAQAVAGLERRVQDLRVTQMASTQLAAQIRLVQQNDRLTCERLKAALDVTIPLWKSQMAAALGLARATDSMAMQSRFAREAARGIRRSAGELEAQTAACREAAGQSDKARAQPTADALLRELEEIEQGLRARQDDARAGGAERSM